MNSLERLQTQFCPFGYLDVRAVARICDEAGMHMCEAFDIINDFREGCGHTNFDTIDPVYCILDFILEQARALIQEYSGYDFVNNYQGLGSEICTYGNYLASSYDWSEQAHEELTQVIKLASPEVQEVLMSNQYCSYFLGSLDIEIGV